MSIAPKCPRCNRVLCSINCPIGGFSRIRNRMDASGDQCRDTIEESGMMEIQVYKNRQGQWTATVLLAGSITQGKATARKRLKVLPQPSFKAVMERIGNRVKDDDRICILHDEGII